MLQALVVTVMVALIVVLVPIAVLHFRLLGAAKTGSARELKYALRMGDYTRAKELIGSQSFSTLALYRLVRLAGLALVLVLVAVMAGVVVFSGS